MAGILRALAVGLVLCIPAPAAWRSTRRLSWTSAVVVGVWLTMIAIVFIAEIPSRILYYVDSRGNAWTGAIPALKFAFNKGGAGQSMFADAIANTVQGIFAVIMLVIAFVWGERQKKAGRFSRR